MIAVLAAWIGLVLAGFMATAAKVLQQFSRRELELYCQKRDRMDRFNQILDEDENVLFGVECLQVFGTTLFFVGAIPSFISQADAGGPLGTPAVIAMATLLLLAVTSWLPLAVAQFWSAPFLFHTWSTLKSLSAVALPIAGGRDLIERFMRRLANRPEAEEDEEEAFEDEIRSIVTEGLHEGLLEPDASEMIEGVIELGDTEVSDIMTPRSNIDALDITLNWQAVLEFVVEVGRTRIPVYEKTLDNIVGVVYVKDLLREIARGPSEPRTSLRALLRKPWFVPTTKPLDEMLHEFQKTRSHLAIVVDEYRSVSGVVTIEDILEEIVGEINDESDKESDDEISRLDDHTAEILGPTHIHEVNDRLGLQLPEPEDCDTVAGLLIRRLGQIPKPGDSVLIDGVRLTVIDASRRKIELVRVETTKDGGVVPLRSKAV